MYLYIFWVYVVCMCVCLCVGFILSVCVCVYKYQKYRQFTFFLSLYNYSVNYSLPRCMCIWNKCLSLFRSHLSCFFLLLYWKDICNFCLCGLSPHKMFGQQTRQDSLIVVERKMRHASSAGVHIIAIMIGIILDGLGV